MTELDRVIYDIERCTCHVPDACRDCSKYRGAYTPDCMEQLLTDALKLLKEQTIESTPWIDHLYKTGSKRFECSHCHKTSWRNSPYCPDCGTKMDGMVIMDD